MYYYSLVKINNLVIAEKLANPNHLGPNFRTRTKISTMKNSGIISICLIVAACASSKKNDPILEVLQVPIPNEVTPAMANLQLSEYLKRIPGIQVSGAVSDPQISIRGINTFGAGNEPLYVLDGVVIGSSYNQVTSLVEVTDIEKVRVLKSGGETASYGARGTNGVILIKTKKD